MNFTKRSATSMPLILLVFSILSISVFHDNAFAQETGMEISANASEGSTTISINGETNRSDYDITIIVTAPNGNIVSVDQLSPDANGNFMTEIKTAGPLWKQDGVYTITAQQGDSSIYKLSLQVGIIGGTTSATSVTASSLDKLAFVGGDSLIGNVGLFIMADAVPGATSIGISGHTDKSITDITLIVTAPNGNIVSVDQVSPDANGNFMTEIKTASPLWKQDGVYTITAQQGEASIYKDSVEVEIVDGIVIPEFGTIAAMILAVGIVTIIAVSAKTRLGIIPKY